MSEAKRNEDRLDRCVIYDTIEEVTPKINTNLKTKSNSENNSIYREEKISCHTTINVVGIVGRISR